MNVRRSKQTLSRGFKDEDFDRTRAERYTADNGLATPHEARSTSKIPVDPLVEEVRKEIETDTGEMTIEADKRREARWDREKAIMDRSAQAVVDLARRDDTLGKLANKLFDPIHIQGGPCTDIAPENERFVSLDAAFNLTCPACQSYLAILEGEAPPEAEPDPVAKALYVAKWRGQFIYRLKKLVPKALVNFAKSRGIEPPPELTGTTFIMAGSADDREQKAALARLLDQLIELTEKGAMDDGIPDTTSFNPSYTGGWTQVGTLPMANNLAATPCDPVSDGDD